MGRVGWGEAGRGVLGRDGARLGRAGQGRVVGWVGLGGVG